MLQVNGSKGILMKGITIGEVARRTNVRASAIRYYERVGSLPEPVRVHGRRRYEQEVISQLALLKDAKRAGFTLREIRVLLHGFPAEVGAAERWRTLASEKLVEVHELITQLGEIRARLKTALRCECSNLGEWAELMADF
jgi:MerR family transcriptional regulator, redox-sensitive transcriptional activator SoxR